MALLHCDGFDGQTALLAGAYGTSGVLTNVSYVTGRTGTGYALKGAGPSGVSQVEITKALPSALSTVIVGFAMANSSIYNSGDRSTPLLFKLASTTVLAIRVVDYNSSDSGKLSVNRGATVGTGTVLGYSPITVPTYPTYQYIEVKLVCSATSGTITVRQNGVQTLNLTGVNTGSATIDAVSLRWGADNSAGSHGASFAADDWYICDTTGSINNDFLNGPQILTLLPNGNGSNSGLTGSDGNSTDNYQLVDEVPPSATDYVGSDVAGTKDTYAYSDLPAGYRPVGTRVQSYASGSLKGRNVARGSSGTLTNGSDVQLIGTPVLTSTIVENDPATGVQWTAAGLNAAEFGWEVRP